MWEEISWQEFYKLYFALHILTAEVLTLIREFTTAEAIYPILLEKARCVKDRCSVYLVMYYQYEMQVCQKQTKPKENTEQNKRL